MLIDRGFRQVRPLAGGLDAWVEAGYAIEAEPLIAIRDAESSRSSETGRQ
jgi:3-mercaptopyruvate sulfurtransferase SseA